MSNIGLKFIEELTRGQTIPVPAVSARHARVIAEVIANTWDGLMGEDVPDPISEIGLNFLLRTRLRRLHDDTCQMSALTRWSQIVGAVSDSSAPNKDGNSLEKRPDLSLDLKIPRRSCNFPFQIECKIIDQKHGKNVSLYCDNGIARFVKGEYAWYSLEGMMVAYVYDGQTIDKSLVAHLQKTFGTDNDPFLTKTLPEPEDCASHELAHSRHDRSFLDHPGPISIWHLWLRTNSRTSSVLT